jgi:N-acetylglucosamine-6-phosphate deacetylase
MEGPYLSPEDGYRGAHSQEWVKNPDWSEFEKYCLLSGNQIILVTMAPELPGAIAFIARCHEHDIHVALGHHAAMGDILEQAVHNGAELSTHLGNACANMINRHNNVLWPQLADDRLFASLILDGFHLNAHEAKVFYRSKGPTKVILVSDLTQYAGLPPGKYDWNDTVLEVGENGKLSLPKLGVLAGAGTHLLQGISNLVQFTGCAWSEAIHAASLNPARLLQREDIGRLRPGARADIIVLNNEQTIPQVMQTMVAGQVVYDKKPER